MNEAALHHRSVHQLRRSIEDGSLSSRELLDHFLARIDALDSAVNAVVTLDVERAVAAAAAADEATAGGRSSGPLHGIPITVKDALAVRGTRSTGGAVELADHVARADADVVAAVRAAGAIPFAKTNVPSWSGDIQTYNDVFGTTNNPLDAARTPGGSSGGPAASVALGFTGFELGTDIGGSIRIPSAYCGVVGHKPSYGLVPCGGYIDRVDYGLTEPDINVHGPIARSVDDLELLLDVIAGPRPDAAIAVRHVVPPARHERIDACRVAVWPDSDACPASAATVAAVEQAGDVLASLGATVDRDARPAIDADEALRNGLWIVGGEISPSLADDEFEFFRSLAGNPDLDEATTRTVSALTATHRSWLAADVERAKVRAAWRSFFGAVDALVCPVIITPPFEHVQEGTVATRTVPVDGVERPYLDLLWWTVLVGMAYLPATVVPVATTDDGLPVAVQVVGPYMEDRTALAVAGALRRELGPMTFVETPGGVAGG
jgi:amidase